MTGKTNAVVIVGGGGMALDVKQGPVLPAVAVNDQIFVVTDEPAENIYMSTEAPDSPGIWITIKQSGTRLVLSEAPVYVANGLSDVFWYDGSELTALETSLGVNGEWVPFSPSVPPIGTPLESFTWEQIDKISRWGNAKAYWPIGATKNVTVESITYPIEIIGFDHDDLDGTSGKAGITFCLQNCFDQTKQMNTTSTNSGGWDSTAMRVYLNDTFYKLLPEDLQNAIKSVVNKTTIGGQNATIASSADKLFLLSEVEISGANPASGIGEGQRYDRFKTVNDMLKRRNGIVVTHWLRSPWLGDTSRSRFLHVAASGLIQALDANSPTYFAPAFCI